MVKFPPQRVVLIAMVAGLLGTGALSDRSAVRAADDAPQQEPTREQVMQELQALREKVQHLEQQQSTRQEQLTAKEVGATVDSVLRDADRRSQLLQPTGFTAGWSNGKFLIQSEDGNFVLNPSFWGHFRYVANYREEDAGNEIDGDATTENGLEVRWLKMIFEGKAFEKLKYRFQFSTVRSTGNVVLEDAYVTYPLNDLLAIKGGQYKEPTFHEERTREFNQLAVERSLVNFVLGGGNTDRVQGIAVILDDGPDGMPYRIEAGLTDGPNTDNTNFLDAGGSPFLGIVNPDFGLYGRADYLVMGDWKNYEDFTSRGTEDAMLVFGGGASYAQAGDGNALLHTIDAQYEHGRLGIYGALLGVYSDTDTSGSLYDFGLFAQASYLLNKKWEVFGRYEYIDLDNQRGAAFDDHYHVIAAGVNYYMRGNAARLTLDVSYLPNGTPANADGLGILDPDADGDQLVLRGQFQLLL